MAAYTSSSSLSSSTAMVVQETIIEQFHHSRKLLLYTPLNQSPTSSPNHNPSELGNNSFDANVVMVLSVLLCALICSLGLNSIIRCALRCSSLVSSDGNNNNSSDQARLANTGIKKKALKTFPTINYSGDLKLPGLDSECVICLSEFSSGEKVKILPKCNHGFHVKCIDKWLNSHSSCPTCRHCLIETCQKIVGCMTTTTNVAASGTPPVVPPPPLPSQPQETIVRIAALEPEGLVRSYQT